MPPRTYRPSDVALSVTKAVGRASARHATVRRGIGRITSSVRSRPQTIRRGPAKGLRINVAGSRLGYVLGTSETHTQDFMAHHLPSGAVFYDLGANIGFLSLVASALVGLEGAVYAFEPWPANAAAARVNAEMNRLAQMRIIEVAIGDSVRMAAFARGRSDQDGHLVGEGEDGLAVRVLSVDAFLALPDSRPPALIKIDIEGQELAAIRGMRQTIRDHRPIFLVEMHDAAPSLETHPIAVALREASYDVRWLEPINGPVGHWVCHLVGMPSDGFRP